MIGAFRDSQKHFACVVSSILFFHYSEHNIAHRPKAKMRIYPQSQTLILCFHFTVVTYVAREAYPRLYDHAHLGVCVRIFFGEGNTRQKRSVLKATLLTHAVMHRASERVQERGVRDLAWQAVMLISPRITSKGGPREEPHTEPARLQDAEQKRANNARLQKVTGTWIEESKGPCLTLLRFQQCPTAG